MHISGICDLYIVRIFFTDSQLSGALETNRYALTFIFIKHNFFKIIDFKNLLLCLLESHVGE